MLNMAPPGPLNGENINFCLSNSADDMIEAS
jgi:hypothetical protein